MKKNSAGFLSALCAALLIGEVLSTGAPADTLEVPERPNVVILMTDDQTLRSMRAMPSTRALIGHAGATFANAFVNNPRCCPSRATLLTGQYSHNHGVLTNGPPGGGWWRLRGTDDWLPGWLKDAGYRTAHVGKFLNGYGRDDPLEVPPGWDEWYAPVDPTTYRYLGQTLNENGSLRSSGGYATDETARRATEIVRRLAPAAQPFLLSVAFLAPHTGTPRELGDPPGLGTPAVAPRHAGRFATAQLPIGAAFNEADVSDKPPRVRRPPLSAGTVAAIETLYRQRLESLLAVDEAVAAVVAALRDAGELDRTLILFTSDNGYLAGEHRLSHGKAQVYDPATRVPLLMRGPGVPPGVRPRQLVSNADLAPTILEAAGAAPGRLLDGRSLLPLTRNPARGRRRALLIEVWKGMRIRTAAVRTPRWLYAEHAGGRRELYDLRHDPEEIESLHASPAQAAARAALARTLRGLRTCRGRGCMGYARASAR
jgi:arylsulfatase A-like enzyme